MESVLCEELSESRFLKSLFDTGYADVYWADT